MHVSEEKSTINILCDMLNYLNISFIDKFSIAHAIDKYEICSDKLGNMLFIFS
jgi:hypothetical protein